ncbi:uncharacterized protein LOC129595486 [Paramacrobiotus metropolitanus]|uniref:uncharacterized protein LOC129595486 n=1 Tax=Paramacrobiotus metropolitanus TaxID=2943436 RepID=UPI0024464493|nr:uncharacterized protein LOC129595486 [Paramacrobiotus metropolitanus]
MKSHLAIWLLYMTVYCRCAAAEEGAGNPVPGEDPAAKRTAWDFPGGNDALYDFTLASLLSAAPRPLDVEEAAETVAPPKKRFMANGLTPQQSLRALFRNVHRLSPPVMPETATLPTAPQPSFPRSISLGALLASQPAFSGKHRTRLNSFARYI